MANLARRQQERTPAQPSSTDPFRTFRDLLRWSPFGDIEPMFPRMMSSRFAEGAFVPDIDLKETPDALVLKADLPGMREDDIDVAVVGNRLTISGRREEEQRREDEQYYTYERQYGSFARTFTLPDSYDPESVNANMEDGVLTVSVPRRPGAQARHIPVKAQPQSRAHAASGGQPAATTGAGHPHATSSGRSGAETPAQGERAAAAPSKSK